MAPSALVRLRCLSTLLLAATVAGCGSASPGPALDVPAPGAVKPPSSSRVVTIVMENKESGEVLGSGSSPYLNRLARRSGVAVDSYGVRHPSLPNYLALTSGATHGIRTNCTSCHVRARSIVDQLEAAHLSWKAYLEDLPRPCFQGAGARGYAKKHNPFVYYDAVRTQPQRCNRVVPYQRLAGDLRRGALPDYAFIVPNLCNDTHDCGVRTGDPRPTSEELVAATTVNIPARGDHHAG